jgi:hypothetical protein
VEVSPSKSTRIDQARRGNAGRVLSLGGRGDALEDAEHDGRALAMVAGVVPFAIVVDDAHLLDDVTLSLLKAIAGQGVEVVGSEHPNLVRQQGREQVPRPGRILVPRAGGEVIAKSSPTHLLHRFPRAERVTTTDVPQAWETLLHGRFT